MVGLMCRSSDQSPSYLTTIHVSLRRAICLSPFEVVDRSWLLRWWWECCVRVELVGGVRGRWAWVGIGGVRGCRRG